MLKIDQSSAVSVLKSLIEIDTSNPPGKNYQKMVDVLKDLLAPTGCQIKRSWGETNRRIFINILREFKFSPILL